MKSWPVQDAEWRRLAARSGPGFKALLMAPVARIEDGDLMRPMTLSFSSAVQKGNRSTKKFASTLRPQRPPYKKSLRFLTPIDPPQPALRKPRDRPRAMRQEPIECIDSRAHDF